MWRLRKPVTAAFALLEDVRNDCMYPGLRPRKQPTSAALAISLLCQLPLATSHGGTGTR